LWVRQPTTVTRNSGRSGSKVICATLTIEVRAKKKEVSSLVASLIPERIEGKRLTFQVSSKEGGNILLLNFSAADLVSLRAGMNSVLRLTLSALKSIRKVNDLDE